MLFSTLPPAEIQNRIEKVLTPLPINPTQAVWFCVIENNNTFLKFGEYAQSQLEAKTKVTQKCQAAPYGFYCDEFRITCDEIKSPSTEKICQLKNYENSKSYLGKGRNLLEAEFKTREQCQNDVSTSPVHCGSQVVCQ